LWFASTHKLSFPEIKKKQKHHALNRDVGTKRSWTRHPMCVQCSHELNSNQLNLAFQTRFLLICATKKKAQSSSLIRAMMDAKMQKLFFTSRQV
jgi:hypothetical protein